MYRRDGRTNFGGGSFGWELKVLVPFLRVKVDQRANSTPPILFFANASDQNSEITIMFKIVKRSYNNASEVDTASKK